MLRQNNNALTQRDIQIQCKLYQNFNNLFCRNGKTDLQFNMELQWALNQATKNNETEEGGTLTLPDFKRYYKTIEQPKQCSTGISINIQTYRVDWSPEINPNIYGQLITNKGAKTIQWEKNGLFNRWV